MPLVYFPNQLYRRGVYADITTGVSRKKLKEHGIGDEPVTRNWKDLKIMQWFKKLAK